MDDFKYKNLFEKRNLALVELRQYYKDLRRYECENNIPVKGIEIRKKIYYLIRFILKIDKILNRRTVKVIGDKRTTYNGSKIYSCTHIGRYDIESAIEAVGEDTWFIMGDPLETYRNLNGLFLWLHGVSWFEMDDKYDAHTVNVRQTKILLNGGSELCFPEQAWNLDPVIPVGEIHPGIVRRAIKTQSPIIPVGIEQYRGKYLKNYYVNIGEIMDLSGADIKDAKDISYKLREDMAGLKYEIWEKYGQETRDNLPKDWDKAYEEYIESIMCDTENGYTIEEIAKTKYHDLDIVTSPTPEEVFAYLSSLEIKKDNAFLAHDKEVFLQRHVLKKSI